MYFSATGTTKKVISGIAGKISELDKNSQTINVVDFTLPKARKNAISFTSQDVVILGVPVIAGRVPNVLLKYL
ncbi:MAG: ferredoxin, partial [Syntrophomonadaceae bacterium]|nr:ferredoxin [Syntrophomonadaceae bacterium]